MYIWHMGNTTKDEIGKKSYAYEHLLIQLFIRSVELLNTYTCLPELELLQPYSKAWLNGGSYIQLEIIFCICKSYFYCPDLPLK